MPTVGTAPHSFLLFRGTLERHFLRFEYKVPSMPFFALWKPQKHRRFQPLTFHLLPLFLSDRPHTARNAGEPPAKRQKLPRAISREVWYNFFEKVVTLLILDSY